MPKAPRNQFPQLTMGEAVAIIGMLSSLPPGKVQRVEKEKEPVKPKFRDVLKRTHDAHPGECREMSNHGSWFYHLCLRNQVPCTRRQASKFLQKRGRAYAAKLQEIRAESASTVALLGSVR